MSSILLYDSKNFLFDNTLVCVDYEEELAVRKGFTSQRSIMIHKDLLIKPNRLKIKKERDKSVNSGYTSEGTGTCDETIAGWQQDSHHTSKKKKKNKEKYYDAEDCKRKRKLEDIFEGSELLDTKKRRKDKHEKMH
jgi:hypothetical protein